jgi:AraC family transcriptional regulator
MGSLDHRKSELHTVTTRDGVTLSLCRHKLSKQRELSYHMAKLGVLKISLPPKTRTTSHIRPTWAAVSDVLFVPPGGDAHVRVNAGEFETLSCFYPEALLRDAGWTGSIESAAISSAIIKADFNRLLTILRMPGLAASDFVGAASKIVLFEVLRHLGTKGEEVEPRPGGLTAWRHGRIRERLANENKPIPTVTELAALCGITSRHLTRAYRNDTGESIGSVVARSMAERAKRDLGSGRVSIKRIAADLGFSSTASFSVAFTREVGMRPSAFRESICLMPT